MLSKMYSGMRFPRIIDVCKTKNGWATVFASRYNHDGEEYATAQCVPVVVSDGKFSLVHEMWSPACVYCGAPEPFHDETDSLRCPFDTGTYAPIIDPIVDAWTHRRGSGEYVTYLCLTPKSMNWFSQQPVGPTVKWPKGLD